MRLAKTFFIFAALLVFSTLVSAQAPAQAGAAKIGVVNSDLFSNPTSGITRLVAALRTLDTEFKPKRDEINTLIGRFNALQQAPPAGTTEAQLITRREQAETLQLDIRRKQEDARVAYAKRHTALTDPLRISIFTALQAYAKARGVDVLVDLAKFPDGILLLNQTADLTPGFIRDFNSKNP